MGTLSAAVSVPSWTPREISCVLAWGRAVFLPCVLGAQYSAVWLQAQRSRWKDFHGLQSALDQIQAREWDEDIRSAPC